MSNLMKIENLATLIINALPYKDQVTFLEFASNGENSHTISFQWRESNFNVSVHKGMNSVCVGELQGDMVVTNDKTLLLKQCINIKNNYEEIF